MCGHPNIKHESSFFLNLYQYFDLLWSQQLYHQQPNIMLTFLKLGIRELLGGPNNLFLLPCNRIGKIYYLISMTF